MTHQAADLAQRRCEVRGEGTWTECPFAELKEGQTFRMFEPNGGAVIDTDGIAAWKCCENAFQDDRGIWSVHTDKVKSEEIV